MGFNRVQVRELFLTRGDQSHQMGLHRLASLKGGSSENHSVWKGKIRYRSALSERTRDLVKTKCRKVQVHLELDRRRGAPSIDDKSLEYKIFRLKEYLKALELWI